MRLFVAVWPPEPVVAQLAALPRPSRPGVHWTTTGQWHVTLRFLGAMDSASMSPLAEALSQAARHPPVTAVAGPALTRLGPAVLCLPVAGLDDLAAAVVDHTAAVGDRPGDRPFRGHLTIARATRGADLRPATPVALSATWRVDELTLVSSTLHQDGARYDVIGRYRLGEPGG